MNRLRTALLSNPNVQAYIAGRPRLLFDLVGLDLALARFSRWTRSTTISSICYLKKILELDRARHYYCDPFRILRCSLVITITEIIRQ